MTTSSYILKKDESYYYSPLRMIVLVWDLKLYESEESIQKEVDLELIGKD